MISRIILLVTYVIALVQLFWMSSKLPDNFAVHFAPSGEPDSWAVRGTYLTMMITLFSFMTLLWLFVGMIVKKIPLKYVNLPNRDYWMAPERKADTYASVGAYMASIGIAVNILLICVNWLTFWANMQNKVALNTGHTMIAVGVFIAALAIIIGRMMYRFRKT